MLRQLEKRKYEKAFGAVQEVIHEWDPYALLAGGAPYDEFNSEIKAVVAQLDRIQSSNDAAHVISRVFSSSFEPELFQTKNCQSVGERLYEVLAGRGILERRS